jgi:SAM-dependent methyltransferase
MISQTSPANYYGNVNPTLLGAVNPEARRVCEFGCGSGALARAIRQRCPGVHYAGVELMADEIALARDVLDVALVRNLDAVPDWSADAELSAALPPDSLDHVIFGDVLEHLYDPQRALQQAAKRLIPGGSALVCIPNVQHWSVFVHLMRGSWPQADAGLFDRTHIRWFALTDMVKLLQSAGLVVERVIPRVFSPEQGQNVTQSLKPLADVLGINHAAFVQRSLPLQYVLEGRKVT